MNDFNKARVIPWNPKKREYCKIWSHQYYSFRAPEGKLHKLLSRGRLYLLCRWTALCLAAAPFVFPVPVAAKEIQGGWINDGSDTLTIANMIYCLITGLRPFYYKMSTDKACEAIVEGELPYVDPRYQTRSLIEGRMVEIMKWAWQNKIEDRASIFEVVAHLRETARLAGVDPHARLML